MRYYRYLSPEEYSKFICGVKLKNKHLHRPARDGDPECRGFCFFPYDEKRFFVDLKHLTGIVTAIWEPAQKINLMIVETDKPLTKCHGRYCNDDDDDNPQTFEDLMKDLMKFPSWEMREEYCTTEYSKKDMELIEGWEIDIDKWEDLRDAQKNPEDAKTLLFRKEN